MVVILLKGDGENLVKEQCLYETSGDANCGDVTLDLTKLQNMRVRLRFMIAAAKALLKGIKDENLRKVFDGPLQDAAYLLDLARIDTDRRKITYPEYAAAADGLKGCAIIAFPAETSDRRGGRTPVENLCAQLDDEDCENSDHLRCLLSLIDEGAVSEDMLPEGACQLWWASKQLHAEDPVSKYSGRNEKTKLVCKLNKMGGNAPTKEPPISAETQRDMMAYWHKKQEEQKKLVVDEDVSYGNSQWADPKGLKNHFQGTSSISWRPR
eukprot:TRINITY_DN44421_c0_g1_i1.p2 TRINITY_DN44421_c0_g1~~TRINITY_DN44421_c0_g1_i1.p2  ORF type:complete len:277 (+),score=104.39 TRINITY_DN44421_c0_g1_i1:31-831(+)